MSIPAAAFSFKPYSEIAAGQLFRWRDEWVMKSSYTDTDPSGRVTPIGVILTGQRHGQWEPEINLPKFPVPTLSVGWKWRPEVEGIQAVEVGDLPSGALLYSPQGLAVVATYDIYSCYAGLDGEDHYPVTGHGRKPRALQWRAVLVAPNERDSWPLFAVSANAQPS